MNAADVLIILVGILFCFFGIRFKRGLQIVYSFCFGIAFAYLMMFILVMSRTVDDINDTFAIIIALAVGVILAVISWKLERLLVTIQVVLLTLIITIIIVGIALQDISFAAAFVIALIVSGIMGYVTWLYYRYAFICETAIVGAIMINHVWLFGDTSGIVYGYYEGGSALAVLLTIATAVAGIIVQSKSLKNMENRSLGSSLKKVAFSFESVASIFAGADAQKLGSSNLCTYEKLMVIVPIITFGVNGFLNSINYESEAYAMFLMNTGVFRAYLGVLLEGVFIGGVIYFVMCYETKVSAIYQLFYLVSFLVWFMQMSSYDYSYALSNGIGNALANILKYCIPWIIFLLLDRCIHNDKAKIITMCIVAICWFPAISEFMCYQYFSVTVDMYNCLRWIGIVVTAFGLMYLKKARN